MKIAVIGSRGLSVPDLGKYLPEYDKFGRSAPLNRNITIIEYADVVVAFWDGQSHGTKFVIDNYKQRSIPVKIFVPTK